MSETFTFDRNYSNHEQVAPYYSAFLAIYNEITKNTAIAYDALFEGRIEGLAGSPDEKTGIYLLQKVRNLEEMHARINEVRAPESLTELDLQESQGKVYRGTLYRYGWYVGGTGFEKIGEKVRVKCVLGDLYYALPRRRSWSRLWSGIILNPDA